MEETVVLMRKQLFWSKLTGITCIVIAVLLLAAVTVFGTFMHRIDNLVREADEIARQLEATATQLEDVDWESVGKNLESISKDLSAVDWLTLTDDLGRMAVEAEESLKVAQKAVSDLDIETLNESITELRDVIKPLQTLVNRFS
jgi:predicted PurR-regulated permease PerM